MGSWLEPQPWDHPGDVAGVLVMDGGTKQDGTAKLGLGDGESGVGEGSKPLPLVSSPNRENWRGVLHPQPHPATNL